MAAITTEPFRMPTSVRSATATPRSVAPATGWDPPSPLKRARSVGSGRLSSGWKTLWKLSQTSPRATRRSEEHTSELLSPCNLVCRLLLEKKKKKNWYTLAAKKKEERKKK